LANRLKPLSSCFALAKKTNRRIGINWSVDSHCGARFDQLYSNRVDDFSLDWLQNQKSISLYADKNIINNGWFKELNAIGEKFGIIPLAKAPQIISEQSDVVIIYHNDYLEGCTAGECKEFFDWLCPTRGISDKIAEAKKHLNLDKSFVGVHARGSDFGGSMNIYLELMRKEYAQNRQVKFFVCSDSREYEEGLAKEFPHTYSYKKRAYVSRLDEKDDWKSSNINRSSESVMEAVVDLYLLAATNFKIYNTYSSFAHVTNMMSSGIMERFPAAENQQGKSLVARLKRVARKAGKIFRKIKNNGSMFVL
jgi:hypothetical protein